MATVVLTAADRCDRCNARAYVVVGVLALDGRSHELLFCAHDYRQHEAKLKHSGARIVVDQRRELQSQESLV